MVCLFVLGLFVYSEIPPELDLNADQRKANAGHAAGFFGGKRPLRDSVCHAAASAVANWNK